MKDRLMRSPFLVIAALLIAAPFALGLPAHAQDDSLDLQVVGYGKFAPGAKFGLELAENTELSTYVLARLKEALERHGFDYGKSSHLVMTLAVEKVGGERPPSATFDQSAAQFRLSMGETKPPPGAQIGRAYRISLDLFDRQTGRYLWRARITDTRPGDDPFAASKPMVEQLVKAMDLWAGPAH
jgi:hypothetical protein